MSGRRSTDVLSLPPVSLEGRRGQPQGRLRRLLRRVLGAGSPLRRLDWFLLVIVLALLVVGTVLVWAATSPSGVTFGNTFLFKQLINIVIGLILMAAVSMLDYRQLRQYAPVVLALSCLGLLAVLSPLGSVVNGAKAWITLPGGFQIEPSEYAKIAVIFVGAMILGELRPGQIR
ncbi:MAG: FtsW/RodA/SpoVE family cell cycle protein, partial [Actinobacteria bacterium]|nr:FtsW/RodA/SpoVE family cell cycle protein [Actinomycetota bacterium]